VSSGEGTAYPSEAPVFIPVFSVLKIYLATMLAYDVIKGKSLKWNSNEAFIIGTLLHY
jgi:hypothetical protein